MKLWLGMKLFAVFSSSGFRNGAIFDSATPSGFAQQTGGAFGAHR